jgi:hypothetical protein
MIDTKIYDVDKLVLEKTKQKTIKGTSKKYAVRRLYVYHKNRIFELSMISDSHNNLRI